MGALTVISLIVGSFLAGLLIVAVIVAGWETLRQRQMLEMLRRDRAVYAATSPLPLAAAAGKLGQADAARPADATALVPAPRPGAAVRREPNWIETRPMVLSYAPAVDDETAAHWREPDLRLD